MVVANRQGTQQGPLTIHITPKAVEHVRHFARVEGVGGEPVGLRIAVKGGGCSGLTYDLVLDQQVRETDRVIEDSGIRLTVDKKSYVFLAGTVLDYTDGLNGRGFEFNNPNAKTSCGCGTSFSV